MSRSSSPIRKSDLESRINVYNNNYDSKTLHIKSKEQNGRLILEGVLRVHWGVNHPIQFKEKEGEVSSPEHDLIWGDGNLASVSGKEWQRRSYCMAINNGLSDDFLSAALDSVVEEPGNEGTKLIDNGGSTLKGRKRSLEDLLAQMRLDANNEDSPREHGPELRRYNTVSYKGDHGDRVDGARRKMSKRSSRRLSMINGHVFHSDTSIFLPSHDSVSTVTISSLDPTPEVIKLLLDKFKVENDPEDYCLCVVKKSGETKVLKTSDYPLVDRVLLGPLEEEAKIFIKEKSKVHTISEEVAPFVNLPNPVLEGFLHKYQEELRQEIETIEQRYQRLIEALEKRRMEISTEM